MKSRKKTEIQEVIKDNSRRSFLKKTLTGGAIASAASLGLMRDVFAKESGPIVIGHHAELTGGFSSWGYWHDKCAKAAVKVINEGGGIISSGSSDRIRCINSLSASLPGASMSKAASRSSSRSLALRESSPDMANKLTLARDGSTLGAMI